MKLKILDYNEFQNYHSCEDEKGNGHYVDLRVDNKNSVKISDRELIGRVVEVDYLSPFIELASGVRLLEEKP